MFQWIEAHTSPETLTWSKNEEPMAFKVSGRSASALGIGLLCVLPVFFQGVAGDGSLQFGKPAVYSGDEPHYLLMIHSLIDDGDLELYNNYVNVHNGGADAGERFKDTGLDHQTVVYSSGKRYRWPELFDPEGGRWARNSEGLIVPLPRESALGEPAVREYEQAFLGRAQWVEHSAHPPGLPLVVALGALMFRGSSYVETVALLFPAAAVFASVLLMAGLLSHFAPAKHLPMLLASLAIFGSPLWHYSRALFCEAFLACFALGFHYFFLCSDASKPFRKYAVPGIFIGLGILMKPPFALAAVPVGTWLILKRVERRNLALMLAGPAAAILMTFYFNYTAFGGILRSPQPFITGNPWIGFIGLMIDPVHGLLWFCPLFLVIIVLWPSFFRRHGAPAALPLAAGILYVAMISCWTRWDGAYCYGPRLIVPALPLLSLSLPEILHLQGWKAWASRVAVGVVGIPSIIVNGYATLFNRDVWLGNPMLQWLHGKIPWL